MRKNKGIIIITAVLLIIFAVISVFTFVQSNKWIEKGFLDSEGNAAKNFAALTAGNIHLTDKRVQELKNMSYEECLKSPENVNLQKMMENDDFSNKVDYAYVMVPLKGDEVKYKVDESNQEIYDTEIGTKLDILFLLDVTVSDEGDDAVDYSKLESQDIQRYSYYISEDNKILGNKPTYIFNNSEWGNHICGYSPLYSEEGTYIGALGIELQTTDYDSYRHKGIWAMGLLLIVASFTLIASFIFLYWKYSKLQFERIHTDALTGIYNRTYYNNQFIRKMNATKVHDKCFCLLIADIDHFKKVNDTFGHEIGDNVLIEMAHLLMENFGKLQTARFGGEEFIVGFWGSKEEIKESIDKVMETIRSHKFSDQQIDVTLSIGGVYTGYRQVDGWLISSMLRAADCNLYNVKENGRNDYKLEIFEDDKLYTKS